jgi:hypothetical protein
MITQQNKSEEASKRQEASTSVSSAILQDQVTIFNIFFTDLI